MNRGNHHHGRRGRGGRDAAGYRGGGRRGRGGDGHNPALRAGRVVSRDELQLLLLSLIDGTERHGYELIRQIKSLSRGHYAPSSGLVYPALAALEEAGFASHREAEGGRKVYAATAPGLAEAQARGAEVEELRERLGKLAETEEERPAALERACANLDLVLRHAAKDRDAKDIDAIVDLIDQVARQIERLGR